MSTTELVELRRTEAARALSILGVDESSITHLNFEDGALFKCFNEVADALTNLVQATAPGQVLATSVSDRHPDHIAVGMAARAVVSRSSGSPTLYEYPIWQRAPALTVTRNAGKAAWARRQANGAARPIGRPRLVRAEQFLLSKQRAIAVYESQLPHLPLGFVEDFLLPFESFTEIVYTAED